MKKYLFIVLLLVWAILLVAMHLVTFDLFGDNLWFHYVIAGAFLLAQLIDIVILHRIQNKAWGPVVCFFTYLVLFVSVSWIFASAVAMHDPSPQGLTIWCIVLDFIGMCFCFFCWFTRRKKNSNSVRHYKT